MSLTEKQHAVLKYIVLFIDQYEYSPTYEKIREHRNIKSISGVHRYIQVLCEKGYIARVPHKAGGIRVLKMPVKKPQTPPQIPPQTLPTTRKSTLGSLPETSSFTHDIENASSQPMLGPSHSITIPLYGPIAAGPSIEAIMDQSSSIDIPASLIGRGQHYALEVQGDSMINAAILNGDIAIIRQQSDAQTGDIVAAFTGDYEVTLKYYDCVDGIVHLKPANPLYDTIVLPRGKVAIQGKFVGLIRSC